MRHRTRIHYTESQKSQMCDPRQRGESRHHIARWPVIALALANPTDSVQGPKNLARTGSWLLH